MASILAPFKQLNSVKIHYEENLVYTIKFSFLYYGYFLKKLVNNLILLYIMLPQSLLCVLFS